MTNKEDGKDGKHHDGASLEDRLVCSLDSSLCQHAKLVLPAKDQARWINNKSHSPYLLQ